MENQAVFSALEAVCKDAIAALSGPTGISDTEAASRLLESVRHIQGHGRALQHVVKCFTTVFHHFDLDPQTPANGYRTLVKVVRACVLHVIQKARYVADNCSSAFFRAEHNASELEAYSTALRQLRALMYLGQRLLGENGVDQLYSTQDQGISHSFVSEYMSLHKACFYGRCLGFQFSPALRPFFQTVVISMVSFGENWKKQQSGIGRAALSILTSGKYVVDPELRGAEFERITQNLDMHFWKAFWNLTESELLSGLASITANIVQVNLTLTVPPVTLRMPLASDHRLCVAVHPPVAHWGPGNVKMRLISHTLREGQDSEELLAYSEGASGSMSLPSGFRPQRGPLSPWLVVHFHGGGFVAQTSKSHESYLKSWSRQLGVPILSVDYSLAPEAPFPRALEECFYAYCWALQNCHLLGSTAERVCLAGDSAGGNLCITVSMRAISNGVRVPDGIMAAYPATLLTADASPSRLLTLIDPMLPLGVLCKCINSYAGVDCQTVEPTEELDTLGALGRETALLLTDLTQGASSWFQSLLDPVSLSVSSSPNHTPQSAPKAKSCDAEHNNGLVDYPEGFVPLRSEQLSEVRTPNAPILRNPYVSPLLAPNNLLKGLPPLHIVASALDAMLDDSVMFAKRLRSIGQPVTLSVVEDLPHGFLSLFQLSKETQEASDICTQRIRDVFEQYPVSANCERPKAHLNNHITAVTDPFGLSRRDEELEGENELSD
ncbi:lipase, hormone-sensitive a isoform X2 [Clupea harengus]|nr:lipase, hormone-sensitive a isoform X2 [Clupea harengus]XP_031442433.1 lipase, hormone-sensitive a isoform X2 [Clupea harengus]XP_031442434.1 lipase, hormone-sensitive a isoform X2 [Clupea harengus]